MKPKEALVKDGFLPEGADRKRGRLSLAAIERLKDLASTGWDIEGYSVTDAPDATGAAVIEKVKTDPNAVSEIPNEYRAEANYTAHADGKEIGMRTVCNIDRRSLNFCVCAHPRVWVDFDREAVVVFKPRTEPLKRKW